MAFYNRTEELKFLTGQALPDRAAMIVLYGRRRTGKTSLLRHFAKDRRALFFVADQASRGDQLAAFSRVAMAALGEPGLEDTVFPSWEAALRFVATRAVDAPLFMVLDEFGYLCASDPSLPSVLQRLWDSGMKDSRLHIVLCGSYVSFMEREVLSAKNPLYGRRTGEWLLQPFRFRGATAFFPGLTPDDQVAAYGILGGIPAYLERFSPAKSIRDNIVAEILSKGAPLYTEPRFLLMEELRDPHIYYSVCNAVAFGRTTPNEIAQAAGLADRSVAGRYMDTLREMRVLERMTPVTERNPERTRRGRYRLCDPFFRFWFRFVLPNRSALEAGDPIQVMDSKVAPHLDQHVSVAFEDICRQHVEDMNRAGALPARYDRVGSWWRADAEVDVVAVADAGALLMGECKWSVNPVGTDVLDRLVGRRDAVVSDLSWVPGNVTYALWSRAGFTKDLQRRAATEGVLLFGLRDILA
ncbi:MAG TPA: ATP-binding protein [Myxococcota bacterium]|nr:ATP-binding protein [Myxococcota bacterium]HPB51997.1 ATP-binding protein [Myxococcota bacterium]